MFNATSVDAEKKVSAARPAGVGNYANYWYGKKSKSIEIEVKSQADVMNMW
jgi:hypothetical protein